MAAKSNKSKLTPVQMQNLKLIAAVLSGVVLATALWWYTDHLVLAFGTPVDINAISSNSSDDCVVGTVGTLTTTDKGVQVTKEVHCAKDKSSDGKLTVVSSHSGLMFLNKLGAKQSVSNLNTMITNLSHGTASRWVTTKEIPNITNPKQKIQPKTTKTK